MPSPTQPMSLDGFAELGAPKPRRRSRTKATPATWSVLAFGAAWCGPWPLLRPVLDELAGEGVSVEQVDVDQDAAAAERHRVVTLPTVVILRDGSERRRITGAVSAAELRSYVGLS